jgi:hypothetical protein
MKDDLADNSVFIIPNISIFEEYSSGWDEQDDWELRLWPLKVLHDFYLRFDLNDLKSLDCEHWQKMGIPDWVVLHADKELLQRIEIELARNPIAYVTQAICDEDEIYDRMLPYNKLIEII